MEPVDLRCDLYSLGCVFYYALSGERPFDGPNAFGILNSKIEHRVRPLHDLCPELPPIVAQWVMALMNLRPEHRYQNGTLALAALNNIFAPPQEVAPAPGPVPVEPPAPAVTPAQAPSKAEVPKNASARRVTRRSVWDSNPWLPSGLASGGALILILILWYFFG